MTSIYWRSERYRLTMIAVTRAEAEQLAVQAIGRVPNDLTARLPSRKSRKAQMRSEVAPRKRPRNKKTNRIPAPLYHGT